MLERTDRLALAVPGRHVAAETFRQIFDAEPVDDVLDPVLGAHRLTLQWGRDQLELLEPAGPGPVLDFVENNQRGIFAGGFSLAEPERLAAHLEANGVHVQECGTHRYFVSPRDMHGTGVILSKRVERERVGLSNQIWQITYAVRDLETAISEYTRLFQLDSMFTNRYRTDHYGYNGAITWFDARDGARLDSLEYLDPFDPEKAVARFVQKAGQGIYMASIETGDLEEIRARIVNTGPGWDGPSATGASFIHPLRLHGLLLGLVTFDQWNSHRPLPQT